MDVDPIAFYETATRAVLALAACAFGLLLFIDAPYGRYVSDAWGPTLPARLGWVVMEAAAPITMAIVYARGPHATEPLPLLFFALFQLHYVNRTIVQPLLTRGAGRRTTLFIVVLALTFNGVNGALIGLALSHLGSYDAGWLRDPRFAVGLLLFAAGAAINVHADATLRGLRRPGESGYRVPQGGLYRWITCPNYLGEIIEWTGFAIATWSLAGLAFALFTMANLVPRARSNHRWYRERFEAYPPERRALVPGLF
jgi:protein-S-isoprenylcysteine O-methyltransferase Ste14